MYKVTNVETNEERRFNGLKEAFDYAISYMPKTGYIRVFALNGDLNVSSGIDNYATNHIEYKISSEDLIPFTSIPVGLFGGGQA